MESIDISQKAKLQLQILQLNAEKSSCEEALSLSFKELTNLLFNPTPMKKEHSSESSNDNNAILNLSKKVLNMSTNYILEQKFGKKRPFNEFLTSMFVEIIATTYIKQKINEIFASMSDQDSNEAEEND